ncbi:MAG: hypothetical protein GXO09_05060 [Crenarchaeota archaeon]|nr:hypothetical protein [Thermoproteota archaeon]
MEGWLLVGVEGDVYIVKGDEEPFPLVYAVPRLIGGVKIHAEPQEVCSYMPCSRDPCLEGASAPLLNPSRYTLVDPFEALERLPPETPLARAARRLADEFLERGFMVGLTGSLAYNPGSAHDIDLIVYGDADDAYEVLLELRRRNTTTNPYEPWRLLEGVYMGLPYSIRLMRRRAPRRCMRGRVTGRICVEGSVAYSDAYATPAIYEVRTPQEASFLVKTYRMRYSEIPAGSRVRVCGHLEEYEGFEILVPDRGGYISVLDIVYQLG